MRRLLALLAVCFASIVLVAPSALAVSPHFVSATGSINNTTGALTVNFKEAGLGGNQNIDYVLTADASATWVCVNKGGANPSASNKTTVSGPVSAGGTFNSGKNGNVTASLTVNPPPLGSDFSCPKGQTLRLASVSYSNVTITDTTNGVSAVVGTVSTGCLLPNVRGAC